MSFILRKISRNKWKNAPAWLPEGELVADVLSDLNTGSQGTLSVWEVAPDKANLKDVLVALGSNMDRINAIDFALVELEKLDGAGFVLEDVPGETPYKPANRFHKDILRLTCGGLVSLARILSESPAQDRFGAKELAECLAQAVQRGDINPDLLKKHVREYLVERKLIPA